MQILYNVNMYTIKIVNKWLNDEKQHFTLEMSFKFRNLKASHWQKRVGYDQVIPHAAFEIHCLGLGCCGNRRETQNTDIKDRKGRKHNLFVKYSYWQEGQEGHENELIVTLVNTTNSHSCQMSYLLAPKDQVSRMSWCLRYPQVH